jgi:tetratricopeptide (TPR) repeat protein
LLRQRIAEAEARARSHFGSLDGLATLAQLYHANGFLEEAARCYQGLERLQPSEPRWFHRHATILAGFGEIEPAQKLWTRVVSLAPDYVPARLRLGDCELKANHPSSAGAIYQEVLRREPSNAYAQLGLARIDYEAAKWDAARERLEQIVRQTNFELGYDLIVSLYEKNGQPEKAAAIRGSARASGAYRDPADPWVDDLVDLCYDSYRISLAAGLKARLGHPDAAMPMLEHALELSPDDVSVHFQLGTLAVQQGKLDLARDELTRCTVLDPHFSDPWAHLSSLLQRLGDNAGAEQTLAAGLRNCPDSPGLHLMKARNLHESGRLGEAIVEYQTSSRLRPNEPEAYVELARLFLEQNRIAEGVAQLQLAFKADPGEPFALGLLARFAIETADEKEAAEWMRRASAQPRIPLEQQEQLNAAFSKQFGHSWK